MKTMYNVEDLLKQHYHLYIDDVPQDTDIIPLVIETIKKFGDIIKKFFSSCDDDNCCGQCIHEVYNKLEKDIDFRLIKISTLDLNIIIKHYNEYSVGMKLFIEQILKSNNYQDEKEKVDTALKNAILKDDLFINHIFSDENKCETRIKDAIQNLEVLIDFIPDMETKISEIKDFESHYKDDSDIDLWNQLMNLYLTSYVKFSYNLILNVFKIFSTIYGKLNYNVIKPISYKKEIKFKLL